jgi:Nif-specific ferredoxin III
MALIALNDEGEIVDEDEDDDEIERKVMSIVNPGACIGCQACDLVCPKACHEYAPLVAT